MITELEIRGLGPEWAGRAIDKNNIQRKTNL
jgi:hypothetical protein